MTRNPSPASWPKRALTAAALGLGGSTAAASVVALGLGGRLADVPALAVYLLPFYLPLVSGAYLLLASRRRRRLRWLALPTASALAVALVGWTAASSLAPMRAAESPVALGAVPEPTSRKPVVLVALDGADWALLDAGIEAGELPTFADLVRRGARGKLETLIPTLSPAIWTTVATGYGPDRHGIRAFAWTSLRGSELRFGNGVAPLPGQSLLLRAAARFHLTRLRPLSSFDRRAPTIWGLASAAGERVAVIHWWASWPAEPVDGWIVTDRFFYYRDAVKGMAPDVHGLTYPPELLREMMPFLVAPKSVDVETLADLVELPREELESIRAGVGSRFEAHRVRSELPYWVALDRTYGDAALHALESGGPWDFFAVYLRGLDIASHAALEYDPRFDPEVDPEDARRFGDAVRETYRRTDRWLARFLSRVPEDALVVVASDHGWRKASDGSARPHHTDGPPGVLIAAGPTVSPGTVVEPASVYDLAPTLLHALGLPVPRDFEGRVWTEITGTDRPVVRTAPWGATTPVAARPSGTEEAVDEELLRRLEALGYLGDEK